MKISVNRKIKTTDKLTKIKEQQKNPTCRHLKSPTPRRLRHQVDLIPDLTEEEYLEFEGMCGFGLNAY